MADTATYDTHAEVPAKHAEASSPGVMNVSGSLMVLTYITFAITALVLYKVAWKPILRALEQREQTLKKSVENAEKTRIEMENIDQTRRKIIDEADERARDIVDKARHAAVEAAHTIESKAREESQILIENARREIRAEQDKAMAMLRKESADMVIDISRKVLKENLDEARSRKLTDSLIEQI